MCILQFVLSCLGFTYRSSIYTQRLVPDVPRNYLSWYLTPWTIGWGITDTIRKLVKFTLVNKEGQLQIVIGRGRDYPLRRFRSLKLGYLGLDYSDRESKHILWKVEAIDLLNHAVILSCHVLIFYSPIAAFSLIRFVFLFQKQKIVLSLVKVIYHWHLL